MKRVLYVSPSGADKLNPMLEAIADLTDVAVSAVFRRPVHRSYNVGSEKLVDKAFERIGYPRDSTQFNRRVVEEAEKFKPDVVFIVKGNQIWPRTLREIRNKQPKVKLASWSQDDMFGRHNRSTYYANGLKYYDLVITQKSYNARPEELPSMGAKNVLFQNKAFLPRIHRPVSNPEGELAHDVLFVGFAEPDRFHLMNGLAKKGIIVDVYGSAWDKPWVKASAHPNLRLHGKSLLEDQYAEALSSAKIVLNFLRKQNRDLQTSRSVEIPACGGFMLSERSDEHHRMFRECVEAEYFSSAEELFEKVRYYLVAEAERETIAKAGHLRTRNGGFSYQSRAKEIFDFLESVTATGRM